MTELADRIVAFVKRRDHVTFAELDREVPGFAPSGSEETFLFASGFDPNVIFWLVGKAGSDALAECIDQGRITFHATNMITYLIDGAHVSLPILKRKPRKPLKTLRWLPVVMRPTAGRDNSLNDR